MFPTGNAIERLCRLRMLAKQAAHTLCVYREGAAPRRPVFCSAFSKAGEMFPTGNVRAARPPGNAAKRPVRNRHCGALIRGLQNLETPLHARRAAPTGANFLLVRKFPRGNGLLLFAACKK